jgi:low affinity Fe/Cu permease
MTRAFDTFACWASDLVAKPAFFVAAVAAVLLWVLSGPLFDWGTSWQLVINTGTTILTFLMLPLLHFSTRKDAIALHAKLDGLNAAMEAADDRLRGLERRPLDEIERARAE